VDENADDLPEDPVATRSRLPWLIVAAALMLVAGAAAAIFLLRGDDEVTVARPWVPPSSPLDTNDYDATEIKEHCLDPGGKQTVIAYFEGTDPDPVMRQAAEALRGDDRIVSVQTETRQEAYEQFKQRFADRPELVKLVRPESLPASVTLLPADGVYPGDLADAITDELSAIESVSAGCEFPE
jgi:hypothetical protein